MRSRRVGVLMGGLSAEYAISMRSGEGVADALASRGHDVVKIAFGQGTLGIDQLLRAANIDVAFLALHGRGGEDGCVQGLLELMQIPYTGSSVLGSALAMDKLKAKEMFRVHDVSTPPYYSAIAEGLSPEDRHESFGYPVIVKPRREGSSLGIRRADAPGELIEALRESFRYDREVLVERYVRGAEVQVGVLDGQAIGAIEVVPKKGLYDYEAKYTPGFTDYVIPPSISAARAKSVMDLALRAAGSLGCSGACRVDLIVTPGENEYVLEVNTLPGLTPTSLLPKIAAAAGVDYPTLCERILDAATLHVGFVGGDAGEPLIPTDGDSPFSFGSFDGEVE